MSTYYAVIEDDKVVNIVVSNSPLFPNWVATSVAQIGWSYINGLFIAPPALPDPVPQSITFAQMLIGLVTEAWITEAEGEAWLQGIVPTAVSTLIATLPLEQRFAALARATRPTEVLRQDSLVLALGAAEGKTTEEMDDFFRTYAQV